MEVTISRPTSKTLYLKNGLEEILGESNEAKALSSAGALLVYPTNLNKEYVLRSAELIVEDLKNCISMDKDGDGPVSYANELIKDIEEKIGIPLDIEQKREIVEKCMNEHFYLKESEKKAMIPPWPHEELEVAE